MKLSHSLCLVLPAVALLLAGCPQTPTRRPMPTDTAATTPSQGMDSGRLYPSNIPLNPEAPGLQLRPEGFDVNNQNRTALQANTVYFDFDRSDIKASERPKLQAAKAYLDSNPTHRLLLEGHCDWRGTAEYNLALGERRANAAKAYLISTGTAADKLETVSKGSLEAAKNADDATMGKDRRVDLVVLGPGVRTQGL